MSITIGLALAVLILGFLMYMYVPNQKLQELGRISYFAGLLALLLQSYTGVLHLGR